MLISSVILTFLAGLVCTVWISRHIMISREKRRGFALTADYPGPPPDAPFISVVVAAKDEEANIETCLRTMLEQDYPNFEVIVCNDRSTDRTPRIVERMAARDRRVRLLNIDHLPEGWRGKNHAMQHGIQLAGGEWICMTDADCRQTSPRTLSAAMQYALDTRADMLSVLPTLEMRGFWENVVQPVCSGIMMIWFHPDKVNDPKKPNAYANGAFMLIRRQTYQAVGTHEAVKQCFNEDMHMGRRLKEAGLNLRVVRNRGLYVARMYTSLREILRGWCRIFLGTFETLRRLGVSLLVLLVMGLLPYAAAVLGLALGAAGAPHTAWWWACGSVGFLAVVSQVSVVYRFYKLIGGRADMAWTYPLGCVMAMAAVSSAITRLRPGAKVVWRNTTYSNSAGG